MRVIRLSLNTSTQADNKGLNVKANLFSLVSLSLCMLFLAGCGDTRYTPSDEHCTSDYLQQLPAGAERDTLVEACMTR